MSSSSIAPPAMQLQRPVFSSPNLSGPTPAELAKGSAHTVIEQTVPIIGDVGFSNQLTKLFGSRAALVEFGTVVDQFRNNQADAKTLLSKFTELALRVKNSKEQVAQMGSLWRTMTDILPEESNVENDIQEAFKGRKKQKKGIPLMEFQSLKLGSRKKEALLQAWNNFKVNVII